MYAKTASASVDMTEEGQLGGPADLHGAVPGDLRADPVGRLQGIQAAALFGLVPPKHPRDPVAVGPRGGRVRDEVHERRQGLLHAGTHDLPVRPVDGPGVLRDLVADGGDDLVGETRKFGTEDGGQIWRQHVRLLVLRAVLAGPRHCG